MPIDNAARSGIFNYRVIQYSLIIQRLLMRTVALPFVVSALLLTACSATSSSPEELAASYMDSLIKNDKSLMAKVLTPSDMNTQHWNNYAERLQAIQADAQQAPVTYTK